MAAAVLHSVHEWDVAGGMALALDRGRGAGPARCGRVTAGDGLLVAAPGVADEVLSWWTGAVAH